jgi:hypothetical protein
MAASRSAKENIKLRTYSENDRTIDMQNPISLPFSFEYIPITQRTSTRIEAKIYFSINDLLKIEKNN